MPSPAIANALGLILLLAGSTALAAEPGPANGDPATAPVPLDATARPWTARQALPQAPDDVFRPFEPPEESFRQQPLPNGASSGRDGAATAGRDGSAPPRTNRESIVPAAFQAPVSANDRAVGAAPLTVPSAKPEVATVRANETPSTTEATATAAGDPPGKNSPLPLKPRRGARAESPTAPARIGGLESLVTVGSSLALVLGLFFVVAWFMRRTGPRGAALLPTEVVEVLGRAPLAGRQQMHLLRFGGKLVLVCLSPDGVQSLTEITEPDEVTRLAGLCHQAHPNSATAVFRQVFQQFHTEASVSTFEGLSGHDELPLTSSGFKSIQGGRLEDRDV